MAIYFFTTVQSTFMNWLNKPLLELDVITLTPFGLTRFFLIIFVAVWISRGLNSALAPLAQRRISKSLFHRLKGTIRYVVIGTGLLFGLSSLGFDLSNLALIAGALGVGLGFGLQSIFNNFVSGIILLFESELKIGDLIEMESGIKGEIFEIRFRNTILRTRDGKDIILPNSQVLSTRVTKWTPPDVYRPLQVPFSVAYGADVALITKTVSEAAKVVPFTAQEKTGKPAPQVYLTKFGDYGLEFELLVWVDERANKRPLIGVPDYLGVIEKTLRENQVAFPISRREIYSISDQ